ncbi:MAG TPA: ATP-binding cassette domain-containing protein, partial [bacterium]|nr:ATP-binding cassette domain-containing protein [bacterium]
MIEAKNLTKYYGRTKALDNVSFTVEKGEIVGLLGPNAAGKTTMMRILTCFLPATSGTARVNGYDVAEQPLEVQRSIGYLPERTPLYDELTVTEFLNFVAEVKGITSREEKKKRLGKVIEECGLSEVQHKLIAKLSKGFRQRVGLAQALVNDPPCLILDEPTIGLDPRQITETRRLIQNLAGNRTVILSTHILPEVSMTCQRVIIINEGRIVAIDTVENLTVRMQKVVEIRLEVEGDSEQVKKCLQEIDGVDTVELVPPVTEKV